MAGKRSRPTSPPTAATAEPASAVATRTAAQVLKTVDLRRVLPSVDLLAKATRADVAVFAEAQALASTHFYRGLLTLKGYVDVTVIAPQPIKLPDVLTGTLHGPHGEPLRDLLVTLNLPPGTELVQWHDVTAMSGLDGAFSLRLPASKIAVDPQAKLRLAVRGANGTQTIEIAASLPGATGYLGEVALDPVLRPLPTSVLATLVRDLAWTASAPAAQPAGDAVVRTAAQVKIGQGDCELNFRTDLSEQRFPYGVLFRLVEPRPSILTRVFRLRSGDFQVEVAARNQAWSVLTGVVPSFAERVPIDQPLSIDGFRDQITGLESNGFISDEEKVPMAGTLGLGYVLRLAQQWTPEGLSLGDLVYSLPLAPGEQQKVAIFEQRQTLSTFEIESLDEQEQQASREANDSSTHAVFNSAFAESVRGTSAYSTHAESSSWGAAGGIGLALGPLVIGGGAAGGGGSADSSGSSQQTLDGNRNYATQAAQTMHSSAERSAAARRSAQRTSMRMTTATDETVATTKVITNNNRLHALTIQYWEVLRHFNVTTAVEGVTLVCFVPLEIVRFLPPGQKLAIEAIDVDTRGEVLARYRALHKHSDVLVRWLPRKFLQGLKLLDDFVANPRFDVNVNGTAEDIVDFALAGAFLPCERLYVTLLTRRGSRLGPIALTGSVARLPNRVEDPDKAYSTRAELLAGLHQRRDENPVATLLTAALSLPPTVAPHDVVGFEVSRSFQTLHYALSPRKDDPNYALLEKAVQAGEAGANVTSVFPSSLFPIITETFISVLNGITLTPGELEAELGGPMVSRFTAKLRGSGETISASAISGATPLPDSPYPVAALELNPVLKFHDILQIESSLQHVVRNTVTYSKSVWLSLTQEERAILLEAYTIGVPGSGIPDASQNIPLLNCVANQVLGYYGNAMIMPFSIPPAVAGSMLFGGNARPDGGQADSRPLTTGVIQDALTNFHRTGFSPPVSHVALPTRGVLAEAVLGCCPSGEKIDLTRFWNWGDSPIPQAPDIAPLNIGQPGSLTAATAPDTLSKLPTLITNVSTGGQPGNSGADILKALIESGNAQKDLPDITGAKELADLTGKTLDTAEKARADALSAAKSMASEALKALPGILDAQAKAADAQDKRDATAKEKADKDAAGKKADGDKSTKDAFTSLKGNAPTYLKAADAMPSQAEADAAAKKVVASATGGTPLPADWAQLLYDDYHEEKDGSLTQGSIAFLNALGIAHK
ncbi:MAG TPA: hypothetical protein VLB76_18760 [Thermoanaerobaculia bacterium]|nr:hypothetical protein [Thermoanaerobaculia bacterium]